jgi:ParB/RepB/Spo0J family partition protein
MTFESFCNTNQTKTMQTTEQVQLIPISKLHVSESNTRFPKATDPAIKELAKSLTAEQKTPILVRPHPAKKGHYEIAAGARRYTAALAAEIKSLKAIVREYDDATFEETILTENLQREDPDPYSEAILLRKMLDRGQKLKEIAAALGKSDTWAMRRAKLASLPKDTLDAWHKGDLKHFTAAMMEVIAALPESGREKFDRLIEEDSWGISRLKSRADVEEFIFSRISNSLDVSWLEDPRTFVDGCGPGCMHDSRKQGKLFDTLEKSGCGNCLNTSCFIKRKQLFIDAEYEKLCNGESLPVIARNGVEIQGQKYERNYDWSLEFSKTPKPDAEKVVIFENGTLSVAYKLGGKASEEKSQASPEEKMQNKIAMHQGKRWILVRATLETAIKEATLDKLTVPIDHLVAVFGLTYRESASPNTPVNESLWNFIHNPTEFPERKNGYFTSYDGKVSREQALWASMQQVLIGLIPSPHRVSDAEKFETTYREVAAIIGFAIDAEKYKADLEIPPPKSWGKVDPHTLEAAKS